MAFELNFSIKWGSWAKLGHEETLYFSGNCPVMSISWKPHWPKFSKSKCESIAIFCPDFYNQHFLNSLFVWLLPLFPVVSANQKLELLFGGVCIICNVGYYIAPHKKTYFLVHQSLVLWRLDIWLRRWQTGCFLVKLFSPFASQKYIERCCTVAFHIPHQTIT